MIDLMDVLSNRLITVLFTSKIYCFKADADNLRYISCRYVSLVLLFCLPSYSLAESEVEPSFSFVTLGDTAYYTPDDYPRYRSLIEQINHSEALFSIHVGDIWGFGPCTKENYQRQKALFNQYKNPVIYTPGDNEWTDCERSGKDLKPQKMLATIRDLFFSGIRFS